MPTTKKDIVEEFLEFDIPVKDEQVLLKLVEIAETFSMSAEDLLNEWIAYQSRKEQPHLSCSELDYLERELTSSRAKNIGTEKISNVLFDNSVSPNQSMTSNALENIIEGYCSPSNKTKLNTFVAATPVRIASRKNNELSSPSVFSPASVGKMPSQKYSSRSNSGEMVTSLGDLDISNYNLNQNLKNKCKFYNKSLISNTRYMFQKIIDICDILNDAIEEFSEVLLQQSNDIESYAPCSAPSQGDVTVVGRIKNENASKLTPFSVLLEGDRFYSYGRSVNLELSQLEKFSFFPGQIVAIKGSNPSGKKLVATELYTTAVNIGKVSALKSEDLIENKQYISIIVAAGPFTTSDSLSYEPLIDVLGVVKKSRPDLTVFIGPLIDSHHEEVQLGVLDESFQDLSNKYFKTIKNDIENCTKVIFIPSIHDVFHHPVFPQPAYKQHSDENLYFVSNPSTFCVNDIKIGATSVDVLFHLGAEEISKSICGAPTDRIARLIQHLLTQKSFYPLYPPHESVPLDIPASELGCSLPADLDILLLPSDLRAFVKCVKGRLCVNPGRLAKGLSGGTYARILIDSEKKTAAQIIRI